MKKDNDSGLNLRQGVRWKFEMSRVDNGNKKRWLLPPVETEFQNN